MDQPYTKYYTHLIINILTISVFPSIFVGPTKDWPTWNNLQKLYKEVKQSAW